MPEQSRDSYLVWTEDAERQLRSVLAEPDLAGDLQTQRYWHIRTMATTPGPVVRPHPLIDAELDVQIGRMEEVVTRLVTHARLGEVPGTAVVVDTNVFLHFQLFTDVDWCGELHVPGARLVLPLLVLDEIDEKTYSGNKRISRRADKVLRQLDPFMETIAKEGLATIGDGTTLEILPDEDNHQRRSNSDTELLDRAEFLQQVLEQSVTVVTGDRGMRVRALARDLMCKAMPDHLRLPPEETVTPLG